MRFLLILLFAECAHAADIQFTNLVMTLTNLQGKSFEAVTLVRADFDGVIWRKEASGGRICFTNLHPDILESIGVPTNRIEIAKARAEHRAVSDAIFRAEWNNEARVDAEMKARFAATWAASAPQREREAQMTADLNRIAAIRERLAAARGNLRRTEAIAHDANMANISNPDAPYYYVRETAVVDLENAEAQLQQMEAEFSRKYHTNSPPP